MKLAQILVFSSLCPLLFSQPTNKQKKQQEDRLRKELGSPHKIWINQEAVYIITDEERSAFNRLSTDEERQQFIESFWFRRDPTPDTEENEYREEHYRRIAYANERFASGIPGWRTDRGRIYIAFGPPDEIESHPSGGSYQRPQEEGGGQTSTFPFEKWRYRYLEGIGNDINIEFVDRTMSGEFRITIDPLEKDALQNVPNAAPTDPQRTGLANKFDRLKIYTDLHKAPVVKFKDLEASVTVIVKFNNTLPMRVRADYIPVTGASVLTFITIQFDRKDLQFMQKEGVSSATVNLHARITSMARRPVTWFEEAVRVDVPTELLQQAATGQSIYQRVQPLAPGRYRLVITAKDTVSGNQTIQEKVLDVPRMDDDHITNSSIILADVIEKVPARSIGTGQFVIGTSKVRPRMDESFKRSEKLGLCFQLYNFEPDEKTHKPDGTIEYEIVPDDSNNDSSNVAMPKLVEELASLPGGASQIVVEKLLPLSDLPPGQYTLKIKITDRKRNQTLTPTARFTVI